MPSKIIVLDDDSIMREMVTDALSPGFTVLTAVDGIEGMALIEREVPDLVICDLMMPRMHGFEVCRKIREAERLKGVKVVICSSKSYPRDIAAAMSVGANAYLVKPFDVDALLAKVNEVLGETRARLQVRFWGVRGSLPTPGPKHGRYGGNTPCTEIRAGNHLVILDSGSGMYGLGESLMQEFAGKPLEGHIFIGHTHWDHIQGFPTFIPLYVPRNKFMVYGVNRITQGFAKAMDTLLSPDFFPVGLKEMASRPEIVEMSGPVDLGQAKVSYQYLNHPGITIGFRVQLQGRTVSYISDHEPFSRLVGKESGASQDDVIADFVAGSDLLICDAQYTEAEYQAKKGWGHGTLADAVGMAIKAKVARLVFFHHDPSHDDDTMDALLAESRDSLRKTGSQVECLAAQEGMEVVL